MAEFNKIHIKSCGFCSNPIEEDSLIPKSDLDSLDSPLLLYEKNEFPKKQRLSYSQYHHSLPEAKTPDLYSNQTFLNDSKSHTHLIENKPSLKTNQEQELFPQVPPRPPFSQTEGLAIHSSSKSCTTSRVDLDRADRSSPQISQEKESPPYVSSLPSFCQTETLRPHSNQNSDTGAAIAPDRVHPPLTTLSQEKEILPQVPFRLSFTETAPSTIDFNRNVWSQHAAINPHPIDDSLLNRKNPLEIENEASHFPKIGSYILARAVANSYDFHLTLQKNAFETLHAIQRGVQKLREESLQLLKEQISNEHPKWKSYVPVWLKSVFPYLSYITLIATGLFGIHALIGGSALLGGASIGSFASFITGKFLESFTDYKRIAMICKMLGAVTSVYITKKYMLHFCTRLIPQIFAQSVQLAKAIAEQAFGYYQAKGASLRFKHQAHQVMHQSKKENLNRDAEETVSDFLTTSQGKMIADMSKVMAKESELKSNMMAQQTN